ncbi:MAG: FtsH protease activity modulator HflK [Planctomycetales bacterium]|nr:FtsH protease activity modulator HflK [Planctomycetales bacterium]
MNQPFDPFSDAIRKMKARTAQGIGIALLIGVMLIASFTMFYRVEASDQGVVLRFGKHVRTVDPGLHLKLPFPIEKVYQVSVQRVQSLEFGFATREAGRVTSYAPRDEQMKNIAEMLTGDLNLANVEWIVQYRISNAYKSLFSLGGSEVGILESYLPRGQGNAAVEDSIRDVSESVMRHLVGDRSVDSILTMGRDQIAAEAKRGIQDMLDHFDCGVDIVTVKLQTTAPPDQVTEAFQEVNRARQNKERSVNEAEGERNRQIPAARGKRDQAILEAEGYADRVLLETEGLINAFEAKLTEYEKAPEITRKRLYLEAMQRVLEGVDEKTIIDKSVQGVLPLLQLEGNGSSSNRGN